MDSLFISTVFFKKSSDVVGMVKFTDLKKKKIHNTISLIKKCATDTIWDEIRKGHII